MRDAVSEGSGAEEPGYWGYAALKIGHTIMEVVTALPDSKLPKLDRKLALALEKFFKDVKFCIDNKDVVTPEYSLALAGFLIMYDSNRSPDDEDVDPLIEECIDTYQSFAPKASYSETEWGQLKVLISFLDGISLADEHLAGFEQRGVLIRETVLLESYLISH